jgi:hypothetical protein
MLRHLQQERLLVMIGWIDLVCPRQAYEKYWMTIRGNYDHLTGHGRSNVRDKSYEEYFFHLLSANLLGYMISPFVTAAFLSLLSHFDIGLGPRVQKVIRAL